MVQKRNPEQNSQEFLEEPKKWDEGVDGCRCGRRVGQQIVERYYAKNKELSQYQGCNAYSDFRELLDKEKDLDAVYIMTPDHLHATIAIAAMKQGKHVITHKALSNVYNEIKMATDLAQQAGATHMFCSADNDSAPRLKEWISQGVIGPVRESTIGPAAPSGPREWLCLEKRWKSPRGWTGNSGWVLYPIVPIIQPIPMQSFEAGMILAPARWATWDITVSTRYSGFSTWDFRFPWKPLAASIMKLSIICGRNRKIGFLSPEPP